jgi:hypothetical protein
VGKGLPELGIERVPSLEGAGALDHQATPAAKILSSRIGFEKTNKYVRKGCPGFAWQQELTKFHSYPLSLCIMNFDRTSCPPCPGGWTVLVKRYSLSTPYLCLILWVSVCTEQKPELAIVRSLFHSSLTNKEPRSPS